MLEQKKKFSFSKIVKKSDLFPSELDFSFQGYPYFGTNGGCLCSISIVLFVLFFGYRLITSILEFNSYTSFNKLVKITDNNVIKNNEIITNNQTLAVGEMYKIKNDLNSMFHGLTRIRWV